MTETTSKRLLGRTGLTVSPLMLGAMEFGSKVTEAEAGRIVDAAIDAGINVVDTANVYAGGHSEEIVGRLLAEFGWPVIDMGGIESARWLEALSLAWVVYSHRTGKTHHAFKLVGK